MSGLAYLSLGILATLVFIKRREIFKLLNKNKSKIGDSAGTMLMATLLNPLVIFIFLALVFAFFMKLAV
jgi:hypothetical protein